MLINLPENLIHVEIISFFFNIIKRSLYNLVDYLSVYFFTYVMFAL